MRLGSDRSMGSGKTPSPMPTSAKSSATPPRVSATGYPESSAPMAVRNISTARMTSSSIMHLRFGFVCGGKLSRQAQGCQGFESP